MSEANWVIWSPGDYWYTGKAGTPFLLASGESTVLRDWEQSTHHRVAKRFTASEIRLRLQLLRDTMSPGDYGRLQALDIRDLDADYAAAAAEKLEGLTHES